MATAGTSRGIYKSSDNGLTWAQQTASGLPNGSTGRTELAIAPADGNTVYALFSADGNSFWRTEDAAEPDHEVVAALRPAMATGRSGNMSS